MNVTDMNKINIVRTICRAYSKCPLARTHARCLPRHFAFVSSLVKQELSYRKQIARQLRTQYVEGINSNPVTLKCG